jgi:outer membrane lipoprotein-sorting protein
VVLGTAITYTINGNKKFTSIPGYHIHKVEDTTGAPGKKQSLLDVGLVPPELFRLYNATFLRRDGKLLVFQIMPKQRSETYKDVVWIDPVTHITTRRMHFNREGRLAAWYQYLNPTQPRPRMYVPTRVEVYNAENRLAAVTAYSNIKINLPVDASIFDF